MTSGQQDPKRIVLVGPAFPYRGGIAHFLESMYRGLADRGHDVSAVTFSRQYPKLLFPGKTQYETDAAGSSGVAGSSAEAGPAERQIGSLNAAGLSSAAGPAPGEGPIDRLNAAGLSSAAGPAPAERLIDSLNAITWFRAAARIAAQRPEAVVFQYWMPFFAPALGTVAHRLRRRGIPSFAVVHNVIPHERRPGDLALSRYFLRACRGFVCLSESVERDLQLLVARSPIRRVAHPVYDSFGSGAPREEARRTLSLPEAAPILLFFGFIRRYKGLQVLLESMPRVVAEIPDVRLVVAGEFYDDPEPYRALIERHGLGRHVVLHSKYIPNDAVRNYFSAADVVVQPYISATQSGVAQVAFQFDRPLIVTDVGGLSETVPHERAGLVVPPEAPGALAEAIIRYFREDMRDRLEAGVREEKKKYGWDRLFDEVESLLEEG